MAGDWPPPIGSRGLLNEPHPWAGRAGEVVRYELSQGELALVVRPRRDWRPRSRRH
jgi:hypothetical protein